MAKGDWWGSFSDEIYNNGPFESQEKAICEMLCQSVEHSGDAEGFNIGQAEPVEAHCIEGRNVIEVAQEAACEDAGDAAEDWLHNVTEAQEKELTELFGTVFKAWLHAHGFQPTFFSIDNVISIPRDDPRVVDHFINCKKCKKKRAEYAAGMRKAGEEIQKIIDTPAEEAP